MKIAFFLMIAAATCLMATASELTDYLKSNPLGLRVNLGGAGEHAVKEIQFQGIDFKLTREFSKSGSVDKIWGSHGRPILYKESFPGSRFTKDQVDRIFDDLERDFIEAFGESTRFSMPNSEHGGKDASQILVWTSEEEILVLDYRVYDNQGSINISYDAKARYFGQMGPDYFNRIKPEIDEHGGRLKMNRIPDADATPPPVKKAPENVGQPGEDTPKNLGKHGAEEKKLVEASRGDQPDYKRWGFLIGLVVILAGIFVFIRSSRSR